MGSGRAVDPDTHCGILGTAADIGQSAGKHRRTWRAPALIDQPGAAGTADSTRTCNTSSATATTASTGATPAATKAGTTPASPACAPGHRDEKAEGRCTLTDAGTGNTAAGSRAQANTARNRG